MLGMVNLGFSVELGSEHVNLNILTTLFCQVNLTKYIPFSLFCSSQLFKSIQLVTNDPKVCSLLRWTFRMTTACLVYLKCYCFNF